jgi:threonine dehydratase
MSLLPAEDFIAARTRIADRIHCTPIQSAARIGAAVGTHLRLKCENFQKTGSFKVRGALNKLMQLSGEDRRRGVITISAGNHAQAVAWAAGVTGIPCTVVMPAGASRTKAAATADYGAEVILHGDVHEAFEKVHQLERERDLKFIHPFDDPQIIAGAGSVGLEILEQWPEVRTIVVPIGGGGHISGIAGAIKTQRPDIRIVGVEPEASCAMRQSLDAGRAVHLESMGSTIADGLAPPMVGQLNYEFVKAYVEDVVLVSDEEILRGLEAVFTRAKLVTEPSGAASVGALLSGKISLADDDRVLAVLSGGNIGLQDLAGFFPLTS